MDEDACTYCGTPIPDHGLDCAHHLRVELETVRAYVTKLESVIDTVVRSVAADGDTAGVTTRVAIRQMRDTRGATRGDS